MTKNLLADNLRLAINELHVSLNFIYQKVLLCEDDHSDLLLSVIEVKRVEEAIGHVDTPRDFLQMLYNDCVEVIVDLDLLV